MASLNRMVQAVSGLMDTSLLNDWEENFVRSLIERTQNGKDTRSLTEKQIDRLEELFNKHFSA